MRIGLIDVDGHNFPNLPLMKLSAWHKAQGDSVEFYFPFTQYDYDRVYMSKVFTFTPDYEHYVHAKEVIKGGTGYYYPDGGSELPDDVEHIYPDYSLYAPYGFTDTAYGFLTRGCPRGCDFCIVKHKEGRRSRKIADLSEFWNGQKNIELCDPNMFACPDWSDLAGQLIESRATIDFNQGVDVRIMTEEKADHIRRMKVKRIHFAFDRYEDINLVVPKLKMFKEITNWSRQKVTVYVLVNYNTTLEQDLERVYTIRDIGFTPYIMIYNKWETRQGDDVRKLQRYVNAPNIFYAVESFEDYKRA